MDAIVMSGEPTVGSDSQSTATLMRMCGELEQRIERGADAVPDREKQRRRAETAAMGALRRRLEARCGLGEDSAHILRDDRDNRGSCGSDL